MPQRQLQISMSWWDLILATRIISGVGRIYLDPTFREYAMATFLIFQNRSRLGDTPKYVQLALEEGDGNRNDEDDRD